MSRHALPYICHLSPYIGEARKRAKETESITIGVCYWLLIAGERYIVILRLGALPTCAYIITPRRRH